MNHCGTQIIDTSRLLLRQFEDNDANNMFKNWISNPKVQLEYGEPVCTSVEEVMKLLSKWRAGYQNPDFYRWAIVEKISGENIGQIAFCRVYSDCRTAEIEYCIGEGFWGHGYANEALSAVIHHIFENTDFYRLEAYHRAENIKSGKVLAKSVMEVTDNVHRFIRENRRPEGEICYCITRK